MTLPITSPPSVMEKYRISSSKTTLFKGFSPFLLVSSANDDTIRVNIWVIVEFRSGCVSSIHKNAYVWSVLNILICMTHGNVDWVKSITQKEADPTSVSQYFRIICLFSTFDKYFSNAKASAIQRTARTFHYSEASALKTGNGRISKSEQIV